MVNFRTFLGREGFVYFHTFLPWSSQSSSCISSCSHSVFYSFMHTQQFCLQEKSKDSWRKCFSSFYMQSYTTFVCDFFPVTICPSKNSDFFLWLFTYILTSFLDLAPFLSLLGDSVLSFWTSKSWVSSAVCFWNLLLPASIFLLWVTWLRCCLN